jgi:hypothetical protein
MGDLRVFDLEDFKAVKGKKGDKGGGNESDAEIEEGSSVQDAIDFTEIFLAQVLGDKADDGGIKAHVQECKIADGLKENNPDAIAGVAQDGSNEGDEEKGNADAYGVGVPGREDVKEELAAEIQNIPFRTVGELPGAKNRELFTFSININ